MSTELPLKVALFGSGRIGQVHARNILANPDLELAVIADPSSKVPRPWQPEPVPVR